MRAGSGAFLEAGLLTTADGELHLTDVIPTASIPAPRGAVPVTGDLATNWGWLLPGVDWRNIGLTPQFDVNGPLAARMYQAVTGQRVDGVMAVDVETLQQLLQVTGPVVLPDGTTLNAFNVVEYLTHDQYAGLVGPAVLPDPHGPAGVDRHRRARRHEQRVPRSEGCGHGHDDGHRGSPPPTLVGGADGGGRLGGGRGGGRAPARLGHGGRDQPGWEQARPVPLRPGRSPAHPGSRRRRKRRSPSASRTGPPRASPSSSPGPSPASGRPTASTSVFWR